MSHLKPVIIHKACAFTLHICEPVETLKKLAMFFQDRHIPIDNLQMHRYRNGEATVILHCQVEKDRIGRTVDLLEKLPGVIELEMLK